MIYCRYNDSNLTKAFTHSEYGLPKDSGQFDMSVYYLLAYPVLADLLYQKIQSVTMSDGLNAHRKAHNQALVAVGPILREMTISRSMMGCVMERRMG